MDLLNNEKAADNSIIEKIVNLLRSVDYFKMYSSESLDFRNTLEYQIMATLEEYPFTNLSQLLQKMDFESLVNAILLRLTNLDLVVNQNNTFRINELVDYKTKKHVDESLAQTLPSVEETPSQPISPSMPPVESTPTTPIQTEPTFPPETPVKPAIETPTVEPPRFEPSTTPNESNLLKQELMARTSSDKEEVRRTPVSSIEDLDSDTLGFSSGRSRLLDQMKSSEMDAGVKPDDELDSLFDDVLGESIEDFVSDFEDLRIEKKGGRIPALVDLLKEHGYSDKVPSGADKLQEDPYQIMVSILEHHPISTEEIEKKISEDTPISMYLSNLRSDDLIDQTNDYRWTLSQKTLQILKGHVQDSQPTSSEDDAEKDSKLFANYIENETSQFIKAAIDLGYIYDRGVELPAYLELPEMEVLNIIRQKQPISGDEIRSEVEHTLPVVVMRMLSKLIADEVIVQDTEGQYRFTPKMQFLMVKEKLETSLNKETFMDLKQKYDVAK